MITAIFWAMIISQAVILTYVVAHDIYHGIGVKHLSEKLEEIKKLLEEKEA